MSTPCTMWECKCKKLHDTYEECCACCMSPYVKKVEMWECPKCEKQNVKEVDADTCCMKEADE